MSRSEDELEDKIIALMRDSGLPFDDAAAQYAVGNFLHDWPGNILAFVERTDAKAKAWASFLAHKEEILAPLRDGYDKSKLRDDVSRPATFDAEGAWNAIQNDARAIMATKGEHPATVTPVALLSPIYKKYTGARARASQSKTKGVGGPFIRFVLAVTQACGLNLNGAALDKMIDELEKTNGRDDDRAEAQVIFQSTHITTAERFGPALAKLGVELEKVLSPEAFTEVKKQTGWWRE